MLLDTLTVPAVAKTKNVTEAAIRFALNDPKNPLQGVKVGGRLLVLANTVDSYVPRAQPHMDRLKGIATGHQLWVVSCLKELAADMVTEHPVAARAVDNAFPCGNVTYNGRPSYVAALTIDIEPEMKVEEEREGPYCFIDRADDKETIFKKVMAWALKLEKEGFIKEI